MYEFKFLNFSPDPHFEKDAHCVMKRIEQVVPYGSSCFGSAKRVDNKYSVEMNIRFEDGAFKASGAADSGNEALDQAESKIEQQIEEWRKSRFEKYEAA